MMRIPKAGFTLVELLIVIAMITILMGAVTSGVSQARTRAKIARANTECREMTNAILAYENFAESHSLKEFLRENQDADRGSMRFILGEGGKSANGEDIPVLYNGALVNNKFVDPWGTPYKVTIRQASNLDDPDQVDATAKDMKMSVYVPNNTRLSQGERGQ